MDLATRVKDYIKIHRLIKSGETILVGVSGGADSVSLLHVLNILKHSLNISIHVVHFNHQVRQQAYQDEEIVKSLAAQFNIPLTLGRRLNKEVITPKISEDQARRSRYAFFIKVAQKLKINTFYS